MNRRSPVPSRQGLGRRRGTTPGGRKVQMGKVGKADVDLERVAQWARRHGLEVPQKDLQRFRPILAHYLERLKVLHTINLEGESVAGMFRAEWR